MQIETGLSEYQVLQRNEHNMAVLKCGGSCNAHTGTVEIFVEDGVSVGIRWNTAGEVHDGKWSVSGYSIPVGGEYTIRFRIVNDGKILDEMVVQHVLVGDIWILAGQSNMEGIGLLKDAETPLDTVHFYGFDKKWDLAKDPLHRYWEIADETHPFVTEGFTTDRGVGPGLAFGKEMVKRTGIPIGLVPCAVGGTSLNQWDPDLDEDPRVTPLGWETLYKNMLNKFKAVGQQVAGVLWYQGESDTDSKEQAFTYVDRFCRFVQRIRDDFQNDKLPFFYVQIGRHICEASGVLWNRVQESQRLCEDIIPYSAMVVSIDLALDDDIHISGAEQSRMGRRLAKAVCSKLFGHPLMIGPKLQRIEVEPAHRTRIRVWFSNVNGGLVSCGRPNGFTLLSKEGRRLSIIHDIKVDKYSPNCVMLYLATPLPEGCSIIYGMGRDPYCNIVDMEDMAVPVFGPTPCDG